MFGHPQSSRDHRHHQSNNCNWTDSFRLKSNKRRQEIRNNYLDSKQPHPLTHLNVPQSNEYPQRRVNHRNQASLPKVSSCSTIKMKHPTSRQSPKPSLLVETKALEGYRALAETNLMSHNQMNTQRHINHRNQASLPKRQIQRCRNHREIHENDPCVFAKVVRQKEEKKEASCGRAAVLLAICSSVYD